MRKRVGPAPLLLVAALATAGAASQETPSGAKAADRAPLASANPWLKTDDWVGVLVVVERPIIEVFRDIPRETTPEGHPIWSLPSDDKRLVGTILRLQVIEVLGGKGDQQLGPYLTVFLPGSLWQFPTMLEEGHRYVMAVRPLATPAWEGPLRMNDDDGDPVAFDLKEAGPWYALAFSPPQPAPHGHPESVERGRRIFGLPPGT